MTDGWQLINNLANIAGITSFAAQGVVAGYQAYASSYTSLTESERTLERVRSRLQGLSPQQREEIEIATRNSAYNRKSLKAIEKELQELMNKYCVLIKEYGEVTFAERHLPFSEFRKEVSDLECEASILFKDTLTTTVPSSMDKGSSPENPWWPSSSESPDAVSTPSTPLLELLIVKRPEQVNAKGGGETTPMHAAASGEHATTSKILRSLQEHGAIGSRNKYGASWSGKVSAGGCRLDLGAIINARNDMTRTEPARESKFDEELPSLLNEIEGILGDGDSHKINDVLERLT
ncbi:hypothetical protein F5888DRAFT_1641216, partial [Russula emetica]